MTLMIRKAFLSDCTTIQKVLRTAHKQNTRSGFLFPAATITLNKLRQKLKRERFFVLLYNGILVGTVAIKRRKNEWEIGSLAVLPKYRKQGLGRRLLRHAEKKLVRYGVRGAILFTPKNHPVLVKYYRKQGYKLMNSSKKAGRKWAEFEKRLTR